jgi:hypothetical protein
MTVQPLPYSFFSARLSSCWSRSLSLCCKAASVEGRFRQHGFIFCCAESKGAADLRPLAGTILYGNEIQPRHEWFYGLPWSMWIPENHGVPIPEPEFGALGFAAN